MATNFAAPVVYVKNTFQLSDMLYRAYRMARCLKHPGQGLSPSESQECLQVLNSMVDGWKMEDLLIVVTRRTIQNMNLNQKDYSVGPGQDWDMERPEKIHRAGFIVGSGVNIAELPMEILLSFEQYQLFVVKNVGSSIPLALYYQATFPNGTATVWPVPNVASTIAVYVPQYLSEFSTVDDTFEVPDGYREMLQYGLAVKIHELYPETAMEPNIPRMAAVYKSRVKQHQFTPMFNAADPAVTQENKSRRYAGGYPKTWTPY